MKIKNFTQTQKKGYEFLNLNTLIQRENYINAVVDFNINEINKSVSELEKLTGIKRNAWNRKVYWEVRKEYPRPSYYDYRDANGNFIDQEEYYKQIKNINILEAGHSAFNKLSRIDNIYPPYQKETLRNEWTSEANETFERRLIHMLSKLDKFGFISDNVNLSKDDIVSSVQNNLEFYISATDNSGNYLGRVHARLIWVECYEKASHYRFITTLKK